MIKQGDKVYLVNRGSVRIHICKARSNENKGKILAGVIYQKVGVEAFACRDEAIAAADALRLQTIERLARRIEVLKATDFDAQVTRSEREKGGA